MNFLYNFYSATDVSVRSTCKLDEVQVAGRFGRLAQLKLAEQFDFARVVHDWLWTENGLRSILLHEHASKSEEAWSELLTDSPTKARWRDHLYQLAEWHVIGRRYDWRPMLTTTKYFAIAKEDGTGRTIFSGHAVSGFFVRPPPVCLPDIPSLLRRISALGSSYLISFDFRHQFHQISIGELLQRCFSIVCDGVRYYWLQVPMGWSFSPRIAQSYSWACVLHNPPAETGLQAAARRVSSGQHPPSWVHLEADGVIKGLLFVWYDNVVAFTVDQSTTNALVRHLKSIETKFGLKWGKTDVYPPALMKAVRLQRQDSEGGEPDKTAVAVGLQFGYSPLRCKSHPGGMIKWRLRPKTAARAKKLKASFTSPTISCRKIAQAVGTCVWRNYVAYRPLLDIHELIALGSEAGKVARAKGWNTMLSLTETQLNLIHSHLDEVIANSFIGPPQWHESEKLWVATDASETRGAYVVMNEDGTTQTPIKLPPWKELKGAHIFVLELETAVRAIEALAAPGRLLVVAIDNTAAAAVLRNFYSSTAIGRRLAARAHAALRKNDASIQVVTVRSEDNVADSPSCEIGEFYV